MASPLIQVLTEPPLYTIAQRVYLEALYARRSCGVCSHTRWCLHREPDVDLAAAAARRTLDAYRTLKKKEKKNAVV